MIHQITPVGNSGLRNGILHARHLQAAEENVFYYLLPHGQGWLGAVIVTDQPPMWYQQCVAVPPLGSEDEREIYLCGADSGCHIDVAEYIKWIRFLIDNKHISW
jgi:hypothetical protein